MAYEIIFAKLISGDMVIGKTGEEEGRITSLATLQTVPSQQGVQMMLLPFGYPFEQGFDGSVSADHILYEYQECPEELKVKYMEATTNLTLSTSGMNLQAPGAAGGNISDISKLLKK